ILYGIAKFEGKRVAIPGTALRLAPDSNRFDLSVSKEQLRAAAYEEKNTPNFADRAWATRNFTSFGLHPYWDNPEIAAATDKHGWYRVASRAQKASDLIGKEVKNPQNEKLGKIENFAIDPDAGRVIYAVLSFGGFMGMGDKLFAIPFSSLALTPDSKDFT